MDNQGVLDPNGRWVTDQTGTYEPTNEDISFEGKINVFVVHGGGRVKLAVFTDPNDDVEGAEYRRAKVTKFGAKKVEF